MAEFDEQVRGTVCVLCVAGEIDIASADEFSNRLSRCLERFDFLEVDLSGLTFMDSSGLRALVQMHRKAQSLRKNAVLVNVSPIVARLLELTGLRGFFDVKSPES